MRLYAGTEPTDIGVQCGAGYYIANEWLPDEEAMWHGPHRRVLKDAVRDALIRYYQRWKREA